MFQGKDRDGLMQSTQPLARFGFLFAACAIFAAYLHNARPAGGAEEAATRAVTQASTLPSTPASTRASGDADNDALAERVQKVFDQKCASCHGLPFKKSHKFGEITDLAKMAASPKLVVPGNPAESKMWTSVDEGDMPPEDAKTGQLTAEQKQTIKQWVAAGARSGTRRP